MYSSRRQPLAPAGMHGRPSESATQLHHTSIDSSHDRQEHPFTLDTASRRPPRPRDSYSHTWPSHGHKSLSAVEQNQIQHHTSTESDYNAMMDNFPNDFFDFLPSNHHTTETQSMRPTRASNPNYHEPAHELIATDTISPKDLSLHPFNPLPAPSCSPSSVLATTSKSKPSSSNKTTPHISTPSLTPQTPDGSCPTPETSVDGAADDFDNARCTVRHEGPSTQGYKAILPALSKPNSRGPRLTLDSQLVQWPHSKSWLPQREDAMLGSSSGYAPIPPTNFPAWSSVEIPSSSRGFLPADLGWVGQHTTSYNQPEFVDINQIFDLDNDDHFGSQALLSPYPPLTDSNATAYNPTRSHINRSSSQFANDHFLLDHFIASDFDPIEEGCSRPYTSMTKSNDYLGHDVLHQTVETRAVATMFGEGSRRDTSRDLELLQLRSQGISYREIKQKYGFTEAESTLRGRYRTLTKSKEKRVRKPIWQTQDIDLLCDVVWQLAKQQGLCLDTRRVGNWPVLSSEQTMNKVSWKKVTQEMARRGSYPYGFTTTKKKYLDVAKGKT